jgi:protein SCO1/2
MLKNSLGFIILFILLSLFFLFPFAGNWAAKSLSEITVKNSPSEPWFLKNEKEPYVLVYFGYVGCTMICIPSLEEIANTYKKIDKKKLNIPFYFANIDSDQAKDLPDSFVKSFDKRFKGIYNNYEQINKLKQDFNLIINENRIEISHSSNLYLFKREKKQYKLHKIYITHPYDDKLLLNTILND